MASFQVMYVNMAQGDCTIIKCPNGNVVMVDCGSAAGLDSVRDSFNEAQETLIAWLGRNPLKALIMTHPDKDHYNQLAEMLYNRSTGHYIQVEKIYFSSAYVDNKPLANYKQNSINNFIYARTFGRPELIEVTLNRETKALKIWKANRDARLDYKRSEPGGIVGGGDKHQILAVGGADPWNVSIVAGNVKPLRGDNRTNTASLVVLFKSNTDKILITGDSSSSTLSYLNDTFSGNNVIRNLTQFQVPHHGSEDFDKQNSRAAFRSMVNPQRLIVSVSHLNNTFKHPRYSIIDFWLDSPALLDIPGPSSRTVTIDYWKFASEGGIDSREDITAVKDELRELEDLSDNSEPGKPATFFWIENLRPHISPREFTYGITTSGDTLIRRSTKKKLFETGISGTITNETEYFI